MYTHSYYVRAHTHTYLHCSYHVHKTYTNARTLTLPLKISTNSNSLHSTCTQHVWHATYIQRYPHTRTGNTHVRIKLWKVHKLWVLRPLEDVVFLAGWFPRWTGSAWNLERLVPGNLGTLGVGKLVPGNHDGSREPVPNEMTPGAAHPESWNRHTCDPYMTYAHDTYTHSMTRTCTAYFINLIGSTGQIDREERSIIPVLKQTWAHAAYYDIK